MKEEAKYKTTLIENAEKTLKALKAAGGTSTSWDLKLKLRLSGSALYLALGRLEAMNKITIMPDELNLKVSVISSKKDND